LTVNVGTRRLPDRWLGAILMVTMLILPSVVGGASPDHITLAAQVANNANIDPRDITPEDLWTAALPPGTDADLGDGDARWWPRLPEFNVPPYRGDGTMVPGRRFTVAQTYVNVDALDANLEAALTLFTGPEAASAAFLSYWDTTDVGGVLIDGPPIGDETLLYEDAHHRLRSSGRDRGALPRGPGRGPARFPWLRREYARSCSPVGIRARRSGTGAATGRASRAGDGSGPGRAPTPSRRWRWSRAGSSIDFAGGVGRDRHHRRSGHGAVNAAKRGGDAAGLPAFSAGGGCRPRDGVRPLPLRPWRGRAFLRWRVPRPDHRGSSEPPRSDRHW